MGNFIGGIASLVQTAIILVLLLGWTYGVAKVSAQVGLDASGNPIKQKALQITLGVEAPEGKGFLGLDLKALTEGRCEPLPETEVEAEAEAETKISNQNVFLAALLNIISKEPEPATITPLPVDAPPPVEPEP